MSTERRRLARVFLMLRIETGSGEYLLKTEASVVRAGRENAAFAYGIQFDPLPQADIDALRSHLSGQP